VELGYHSALYINTGTYAVPVWSELDLAKDVTNTDAVDKVDVTTRRTARIGYKANEYGLSELGWKFDMLVPAAGETNAAYDAIEAARMAKDPVDILHTEGGIVTTDGLPATRAVCGVFGGEKGEPLNNASTRSYELSFVLNSDQDVPQHGTTSGGGFVPAS
jgi:hypothetical protein